MCNTQSEVCSVRVVNLFPSSGSSGNLSICETAAGDLQTRNNPQFYIPGGIWSLWYLSFPWSGTASVPWWVEKTFYIYFCCCFKFGPLHAGRVLNFLIVHCSKETKNHTLWYGSVSIRILGDGSKLCDGLFLFVLLKMFVVNYGHLHQQSKFIFYWRTLKTFQTTKIILHYRDE